MSEGIDHVEDQETEDMETDDDDEEEEVEATAQVFVPGTHELDDDEELVMDESTYKLYFQLNVESSSLSFDILGDNLGPNRSDVYPQTCFLVAGTQAGKSHMNKLVVMKLDNLTEIKHKEESKDKDENEDSSDEEEEETLDEKPEVEFASIKHNGTVNRVRSRDFSGHCLAASWSEMGQVYIWDLTRPLTAVNDSAILATYTQQEESPSPVFTFRGHPTEGFALDWSPVEAGRLATGDCQKNIFIWNAVSSGGWTVSSTPLCNHTASVEDIQWSPTEASVFTSCSVDRTIRVWDVRDKPSSACKISLLEAHASDVNVLSWNRLDPVSLVSGGDDGSIKVWDLRQVKKTGASGCAQYIQQYYHHKAAITSVEWHPTDKNVFAASGEDDQLTLWDVSIEQDEHVAGGGAEDIPVPSNLLFIHMGQREIKELHWHPQIPGLLLSTALDGYNVFRTINV